MSKAMPRYGELRKQYQLAEADREREGEPDVRKNRCLVYLTEALNSKQAKPEDFQIAECYEGICGHDSFKRLKRGMPLAEASFAVDTSAFSNIIGQIIYNKILQAYEDPAFLWPDLCETVPTQFLHGERIPGIGRIADQAEIVDEAQPYPLLGLSEVYLDTVPTLKRGFIVPVTREIIIADRTGLMLHFAGEGGYWLGLNKEKRVINIAIGTVNNYKRNGTATNTYLTSGAYVNSMTGNALNATNNEWRAVENAELKFDAILDPATNEPINVQPDTLIVPSSLKHTAKRIISATEVVHVETVGNIGSNASAVRTVSANPLGNYKILSSPQIKIQSGSTTRWWVGQPKKAFAYMEVWAIETLQAASSSEPEFMADIMIRFKVSERGAAQVLEPRRMVQSDQ